MESDKYLYLFAALSVLFGITAFIDGIPIALDLKEPTHNVIPWLLYYNLFLALISLIVGLGFAMKHSWTIIVAITIAFLHTIVWLLLITLYSEEAALKSTIAMNIRSVVWVIISFAVYFKKNEWFKV